MAKATLMGLRLVVVSAAAIVAGAAWCPQAGAIVGGGPVNIEDHPYQVAVLRNDKVDSYDGLWCGGSIRDALHIITAAHCIFDTDFTNPGQAADPNQIDVLAGTADLTKASLGQRPHVATISVDPAYDSAAYEHDAALLTLATPLTLDAKKQPLELIDDLDWQALPPGAPLFVTGWGDTTATQSGSYPNLLQGVSVDFMDDQTCGNEPSGTTAPAVQVCAAADGKDSCQGDSGGPLVTPGSSLPADDRLVGIVSSGSGCAQPGSPGLYTEVAVHSIRNFLEQGHPVAIPTNESPPTLTGAAAIGQRLSCSRGVWRGSPDFAYEFVRSTAAGDVGVAASGPAADYTVTSQDAGTALRCVVTATNPGGSSSAESAKTGVVAGAAHAQQPQTSLDVYAPVAHIARTRCTLTRCTLTVTVSDAGFSAGIKSLRASVRSTYRSTCRRNGKTVACTKHKTGKPSVKALSARRFHVVASKLPVGKQLFTLAAIDKAGHRQALPTRKTVTTKRR
jgi:secreted trypsin-like serine protease